MAKEIINRVRMVNEFVELAMIDSLSKQEREMADALISKIEEIGYMVCEDGAGVNIGGNAGNLSFTVRGKKDVPGILLMAHMDTVEPGTGKKPVVEGNIIKSDGSTILGADDLAGIECILESLKILKENDIKHGDIEIIFTVAEEVGLCGAKCLDYDNINAKYGFVFDTDGKIGTVAIKAPVQSKIFVEVNGRSSHAGIEPEKGVSAIGIAAEAIVRMKLGKVDEETTANIGTINGGVATNIVCDLVTISAEVRSLDVGKHDLQVERVRECFLAAAKKFGGHIDFRSEVTYQTFDVKENSDIVGILRKASQDIGLELTLKSTGGGSDANITNDRGIQTVVVSVGMESVHTVKEQICIDDMVRSVELILSIIANVH